MGFFIVRPAGKLGEVNVSIYKNQAPIDPIAAIRIHRGEEPLPSVLTGIIHSGSKFTYDAMSTSTVFPYIFSEKVFETLTSAGASGFQRLPFSLDSGNGTIDSYCVLSITGRSASIDLSKTKLTYLDPKYKSGPRIPAFLGAFFPEDSWDKSDVFLAGDYKHVFVSEKAALALTKAKLKNLDIVKAEDMELILSGSEVLSTFGEKVHAELKNAGFIF
ncbi:MAG: hypothetical protein ACOVS5_18740 [Oligoflexus sp.]|jgi:hypothetical protein